MICFHTFLMVVMLMTESFATFSDIDLHSLFCLREFFNVGFLVFVEDEKADAGLMDEVKRTSQRSIASITTTSQRLKIILERDGGFPRRTIIATKRSIQLGPLLKLVQSARHLIWALFSEPSDINSVGNDIPYDGNVLLLRSESDSVKIYELLRAQNGQKMTRELLGFIDTVTKIAFFPDQRQHTFSKRNISGDNIKIGNSKMPCERRKDGVLLEKIFCYHSRIMDIFAEKLNFKQIPVTHPGENYSFVTPNGSYSGFFKMLVDEEVDVSVAGFVVTDKRMNDFDFIWPTFTLETMMYVKESDTTSYSHSTPFSSPIWITIIIWVVGIGVFVFITDLCNTEPEEKTALHPLLGYIFNIIQLACNQGLSDIPSFSAVRILYSTAIFGGMLLYFYYSATVLSYLTTEGVDVPFTNFDGFVKNGKYKIIGVADGFAIYYITFESSFLHHTKSGLIMDQEDLPTDLEQGIETLCDGEFLTFLGLRGSVLNIEKTKCELVEIPSPIFYQFFGFAAVKGFQLGEYFTEVLWRLNELGIIERMRKNLTRFDNIQDLHESSDYHTVTFEQIHNLLMVLEAGLLLCLVVLLLELWKSRRKSQVIRKRVRNNRIRYLRYANRVESDKIKRTYALY